VGRWRGEEREGETLRSPEEKQDPMNDNRGKEWKPGENRNITNKYRREMREYDPLQEGRKGFGDAEKGDLAIRAVWFLRYKEIEETRGE
jgi:hypothetical protein